MYFQKLIFNGKQDISLQSGFCSVWNALLIIFNCFSDDSPFFVPYVRLRCPFHVSNRPGHCSHSGQAIIQPTPTPSSPLSPCPLPLWHLTLNTFRNSTPVFLLQKQNISQTQWCARFKKATLTNVHFTQSNASFGRLDVANLNKNNPCLLLYSKHSKTGASSNGCHKSCCYVSKYCPREKNQEKVKKENAREMPPSHFLWWQIIKVPT